MSKDLVIGVNEDYFFKNVDSDVDKLVRAGIQALVDQGAKVEVVSIPSLQYAEYAELITSLSEASAIHHKNLQKRPHDFGDDIRYLFELGEIPSAVDYLQAQQIRRMIKLDHQKAFEKVDVLISPTLPMIVPNIGEDLVNINGKDVDLIEKYHQVHWTWQLDGSPSINNSMWISGRNASRNADYGTGLSRRPRIECGLRIRKDESAARCKASNPISCFR